MNQDGPPLPDYITPNTTSPTMLHQQVEVQQVLHTSRQSVILGVTRTDPIQPLNISSPPIQPLPNMVYQWCQRITTTLTNTNLLFGQQEPAGEPGPSSQQGPSSPMSNTSTIDLDSDTTDSENSSIEVIPRQPPIHKSPSKSKTPPYRSPSTPPHRNRSTNNQRIRSTTPPNRSRSPQQRRHQPRSRFPRGCQDFYKIGQHETIRPCNTHSARSRYSCNLCNQNNFKTKRDLNDHYPTVHSFKEVLTCHHPYCSFRTDNPRKFRIHEISHYPDLHHTNHTFPPIYICPHIACSINTLFLRGRQRSPLFWFRPTPFRRHLQTRHSLSPSSASSTTSYHHPATNHPDYLRLPTEVQIANLHLHL